MNNTRKLNLNISEIDSILNGYYKDKISSTQISKILKISPSKVKNVIKNYSTIYLNKYPEYKPIDNISTDTYEQHILSSSYTPVSIQIEQRKQSNPIKKKENSISQLHEDVADSPYI